MGSVGKAWAVLRGRLTGDQEEAGEFLGSLSENERTIRNRKEGRVRNKLRKRAVKPGSLGRR